MAFMSGLLRLLKWLLIAAVIVFVLHWWVTNKEYLFTVEELTALAKKHAGKDIDISTKLIHRELLKKYPGHILPEEDLEWIYMNAGGWMAGFCVLHATVTEYIILLGTPIQSTGHSGRYWANLTDIVLTGNLTLWKEGTTKARVYQPGKDIDISTKLIHRELQKKYPGHILPEEDLEWIYLNSGGWMASFCVLHATLTEYIMLLGTPIQSSGHSGRYWANLTDIVLTGNFTLWKEGTTKPTFYQPGEAAVHPMFAGAGVQFAANTWVIEYARGVIPSTLNTMLAGIFFTSQDVVVLYNSFRVYNKALALEASTYLLQLKDYFEQKA